jgi:hypothetical protein
MQTKSCWPQHRRRCYSEIAVVLDGRGVRAHNTSKHKALSCPQDILPLRSATAHSDPPCQRPPIMKLLDCIPYRIHSTGLRMNWHRITQCECRIPSSLHVVVSAPVDMANRPCGHTAKTLSTRSLFMCQYVALEVVHAVVLCGLTI